MKMYAVLSIVQIHGITVSFSDSSLTEASKLGGKQH